MSNDFDDLDNLEAFERSLQDLNCRLSALRESRASLEDKLRSVEIIDKLPTSAEEADQLISSPGFRNQFCRLYRQWMTQNVGNTIDVLNLAGLVATIAFGLTIPPLTASFSAIGILRRLIDGYCREFTE